MHNLCEQAYYFIDKSRQLHFCNRICPCYLCRAQVNGALQKVVDFILIYESRLPVLFMSAVSFIESCWRKIDEPCQKEVQKTAVTYRVTAVGVECGARTQDIHHLKSVFVTYCI